FEAEKVGVVVLLLAGLRERAALDIEAKAFEGLGGVAILDAGDPRHHHSFGLADDAQAKAAPAALVGERPVGRDVSRDDGEALHPHRAAHAMRPGNDADTDREPAHGTSSTRGRAQPSAGFAASAALARSCALALGAERFGVSRISGFAMRPASPKKRATRSV